jgi:hypothetical protein
VASNASAHKKPDQSDAVHYDVSPPLRDMTPAPAPPQDQKKEKEPKKGLPVPAQSSVPDPVVQVTPGLDSPPPVGVGFEGVGQGFSGPSGSFFVTSAPPDPNGAVGPNHFVEIVNQSFAVFNKSGTPVYGPVPTNTLWSGFGGGCQSNDDGDGTVEYDKLADRWIIQQFSVSTTPYLECVAVSTSGDPTGSYARYSFSYGDFPDYPKLGVWPDAYYVTFNMFHNNTFRGPQVCAWDRARMLQGLSATQQCFALSPIYGGLLPADLDGSAPPPSGAPNDVVSFGTNSLLLWRFHVDWTTPGNSSLSGPTTIPVAAFSPACSGGGTCIPQLGTSQQLDSLADRLMYRLAYRNFGDHESLVLNHSVTAGSLVGVRWYELRSPNGTPTVYQQGTYAPDSSYRWMGSVAMDRNGDMALGYSVSSSSLRPQIHYTGRLVDDPLGQMPQGEGTIINGNGSQTGGLSRWGDYTSMSVDPSDDCTFWYTDQYLASNGSFNWHTRIGSFKFPSCTSGPSDFSISANPSSLSVPQGSTGTSTINTSVTSGSSQTVDLSASGQPAGTTVSFNPASVTAGNSSTMSVNVGASTVPGTYTITVTGTGSSATHTVNVGLTMTTPPPSDFSISANPSSLSVQQGASGTSTISTAVTSGSAQTVNLSASGQPTGTTVSFNPAAVTAGGSSTMTVSVGATTTPGSYTITVTGTGSAATHTVDVALTVTAAPASDFSISANPGSLSIAQSASGTSTITTAVTSGSPQTVSLSASGQPSGTTVSFNPASITSGGSSTMTVSVGATTPTGSYTIAVTGTGTSATHSVNVSLAVTAPPAGVVNGGFETGSLSGWTPSGVVLPQVVSSAHHSGSYTAQLGSSSPFNGNSTLTQNVVIPSGNSRLTFWYQPHCPDTLTYDQIQMQLRSTSGAMLATVLNVCSNSGAWTGATWDTSQWAGQTLVLWFNVHDDNYPTDPTYSYFDDVDVSQYTPQPNVVQNPGFETGSLASWTPSGVLLPVISTVPHSGIYSARVGSTSAFNGNSTLTQTVTVPAGSSTLSFWYQPHCPDTLTYDQIQMQVRNTSGATLATVLNVCASSSSWSQATFNMTPYAGQTVVLWFNVHDDGYPTDPTYSLFDDVSLSGN